MKNKMKYYKVDLYQVLGPTYFNIDKYRCDVCSIGKIIVEAREKGGIKRSEYLSYRSFKRISSCREVVEDFNVPIVACSTGSHYDSWYDEHTLEFELPYKFDYFNRYRNFIVLASDLNDDNLATKEDLKNYDPEKTTWYRVLKEIDENGIDFDYRKVIDEKELVKR